VVNSNAVRELGRWLVAGSKVRGNAKSP
jgi:hypothetical protein